MKMSPIVLSPAKTFLCLGVIIVTGLISPAFARPVPQNLGNGLDKLVENDLIQQGKISAPPAQTFAAATTNGTKTSRAGKTVATATASATGFADYKASVAKQAQSVASTAITDLTTGRYLVEIMPNGRVPVATLQGTLQGSYPAISVQNVDDKYAGHGVIECYVALNDVAGIANTQGVGSVILQLRPIHSAVTAQSVNQHRVNRINSFYNPAVSLDWDGTGMSIGVMSDSFDSQPSEEGGSTNGPADVATQDLPGPGNTTNSQPVVVLQDYNPTPGATNEGRAMCQIVYDMAPKARIAFATADVGELGFANNIRALGGLPGFTYPAGTQQGFKGDVVCDDVSYLDEPMFQDGIVAQGVNDVVAAGVTYCSSAANNWAIDGYESVYRPVPNGSGLTAATNNALKNTNINLATVPPELYAGGFHNFNPSGDPTKQDVAQTINSGSNALAFVFQWNDPYDPSAPTLIDPPIFTGNGDSEGGAAVDFQVTLTAGNSYVVTEMATPATQADNFDCILGVVDPNGKTIIDQDTGVDETVTFYPQISGTYTLHVHPYATPVAGGASVPTHGPFSIKVNQAMATSTMTQDFNILYFDINGNYIPAQSLTTNNLINNRPIELIVPPALPSPRCQMVISRSNTTAPATAANYLKYVYFGNGTRNCGPAEYTSYLMPVTFGHSAAAGANSVAAYDVFRPNIPEYFTSPGPVTIFFDANNNRLATPQVRLKPDVAAANGVNNTFFPLGNIPVEADSVYDPDTFPNFYGTSAASPNAAALAALVLQSHGGPGSLSPSKVKAILQLTAFPHDLDPFIARGTATAANGGKVDLFINSDGDTNLGLGVNDPNSWNVSYTGPGYVKTLNFNPEGTPQTGGNTTGGNFNGVTPADFLDATKYKFTPGMVFTSKFITGNSVGLSAGDVAFSRSNPAPAPSNPDPSNPTEHEWTASLNFADNKLVAGNVFRFSVERLQQQDATSPQGLTKNTVVAPVIGSGVTLFRPDASADLLGDGVFIPEDPNGTNIQPGMTFNGTIVDGANTIPFSGRLTNKIGHGWTPLDGYGFINAEAATAAQLPVPGVVSRKTHGTAGTFDIPLPINGTAGVECRAAGPNNSYTLVYTFDRPVANSGTVSIQGTGSVAPAPAGGTNPSIASNPNQVVVNLNGVANQQHLTVTLSNVRDTSGNTFGPVAARMDVLFADVDASRRVDSGDVTVVRQQSLQPLTNDTCREDVDLSGRIDSGDVTATRQQAQNLPSLP
jgi:hypothetical protein